jgi:hypothetical protein
VDDAGSAVGTGVARLFGRLECDFPIEQTQTRRVRLAVSGRIRGDTIALTLSQTSVVPENGRDFGGFGAFLPVKIALPLHGDAAEGRVTRRRVDEQGRGVYFWSTGFQLATVSV